MIYKPDWDRQFAETEWERTARWMTRRAKENGMFQDHSCFKCRDGSKSCINGNPRSCEYPHARND